MTFNVELPPAKARKLNKHAKHLGISAEELIERLIEFIIEIPDEECESWIVTLEILSDKTFAAKLEQSIKQAKEGKLTDWETAKRELELP